MIQPFGHTLSRTHAPTAVAPARYRNLPGTLLRFLAYLGLCYGWFTRKVPGPPAQPLALALTPPRGGHALSPVAVPLRRGLMPETNERWLRQGRFRAVLPAGFVGAMYRHLGFLQALHSRGLRPHDVVGGSAGAIVGALYGALPLNEADSPHGHSVEKTLLTLRLQDFLDPSLRAVWEQGAVCKGDAFVAKLRAALAPAEVRNLEDTSPRVSLQVYDTETGETLLLKHGDIVQAVRASASLPILYAQLGRYSDGGMVDQNCRLGMEPGQRTVNHRVKATPPGGRQTFSERRVGRPLALFEDSTDPEHATLQFPGKEKITEVTFLFDMLNPAKLKRITQQSKESVLAWLQAPH